MIDRELVPQYLKKLRLILIIHMNFVAHILFFLTFESWNLLEY